MIKNLKKRFVTIYMVILSCFLVTVLLGIYLIVYHSEVTQSEQIMQMAMQNNSRLEEGTPPASGSLPKKIINFSDGTASVPTSHNEYVQDDESLTDGSDDTSNELVGLDEDSQVYDDDLEMFFSFNNFCVQQSNFWETFKSDTPQNWDYEDSFDHSYYDDYDDWYYPDDDWHWQQDDEPQRQEEDHQRQKTTTTAQTTKATETTTTTKATTVTTTATTKATTTSKATTKATTTTTKATSKATTQTSQATTKSTTSTTKSPSATAQPIAVDNTTATTNYTTTPSTNSLETKSPLVGDVSQSVETSDGDSTEVTTVTSTPSDTSQSNATTISTTANADSEDSTIDGSSNIQQRTKPEEPLSKKDKPDDDIPHEDITVYEGNLARNTIYVKANKDGEIQRISYQYFESSDNLSLEQSIGKIIDSIDSGTTSGKITIDNVKFRYYAIQPDDSSDYDIVFLDRAIELSTLSRLVHIFIVIGLLGFVVLFGVSWMLASWAITPIADAWDKQKQFIADASHELKTPLTIIATNTDVVLSNYNDTVKNQSKWLTYIKSETVRMSKLVSDLLYIAKSDVNEVEMVMTEFNLSHTVQGVCLVFESVAFEKGKLLDCDIDEEITFKGDEDRIKQLITILIDNAIVHSEGNASIMVSLKRDSKNKIKLAVTNTHGEDIPKGDEERLFERFFRVDKARNRSNGSHGLGLNIAQSIAKNHDGEISVTSTEDHVVTFTVTL